MTERKPPEISFASWVDQRIHEAAQRGAFDNLPGTGKPLPRRGSTADAWLQDYLRREGVSAQEMLPTPLRLRKEIERLTETVPELGSEQQVREAVAELNRQIVEWRRIPLGPPVFLPRVDTEAMVERWRETRPGTAGSGTAGRSGTAGSGTAGRSGTAEGRSGAAATASPVVVVRGGAPGGARSRWWHRLGHRGGTSQGNP